MMLTALYEYAKSRGLLEDTSYETRPIDLVVDLGPKGEFLALVAVDRVPMRVPRHVHSVSVDAGFAADKALYALGITSPEDKNLERVLLCFESFRLRTMDASSRFPSDIPLRALAAFLAVGAPHDQMFAQIPSENWSGRENVVFRVGEEFVHESQGAKAYWQAERAVVEEGVRTRCLVTGSLAFSQATHPPIKRVPGTSKGQTQLVSFNSAAFTSMGLVQSHNAPVSREGAEGYSTALNSLMQPDDASGRRFSSGVGLGPDTVVLVWTKEEAPELRTLLDWFDAKGAESGLEAMTAPFTGLEPSASDMTDFYAVTIGGNAARVVVRDWYQTKFAAVKESIRKWFDDVRVVGQDRPPAMWQLLAALDPPGRSAVPPSLATALGHAALFGGRVPVEVLRHALLRVRIPPSPREGHLLQQRLSLIKLTLIRTFHLEVSVALDEKKKDVPYLLGRLFAVLERLQGAALGDINATIRDRYFGAASSTPANVFPRLLRLSMHHSSKTGTDWFEKIKGEIIGSLPAEQFPQILALEAQGLFAVGYYHQRQKFFEKREASNVAPKESGE